MTLSNVVHKLLRPVKFEDKNYEMIPLDLDSLSGRDIKEAKKEFEDVRFFVSRR